MDSYIARVVLHRTDSSDDYTDLHAEMAKRGFERTITGKDEDGVTEVCDLPHGMYILNEDQLTTDAVYLRAKRAVEEVMKDEKKYIQDANKPASVFIAKTSSFKWSGLKMKPKPSPRHKQ